MSAINMCWHHVPFKFIVAPRRSMWLVINKRYEQSPKPPHTICTACYPYHITINISQIVAQKCLFSAAFFENIFYLKRRLNCIHCSSPQFCQFSSACSDCIFHVSTTKKSNCISKEAWPTHFQCKTVEVKICQCHFHTKSSFSSVCFCFSFPFSFPSGCLALLLTPLSHVILFPFYLLFPLYTFCCYYQFFNCHHF